MCKGRGEAGLIPGMNTNNFGQRSKVPRLTDSFDSVPSETGTALPGAGGLGDGTARSHLRLMSTSLTE